MILELIPAMYVWFSRGEIKTMFGLHENKVDLEQFLLYLTVSIDQQITMLKYIYKTI